MSTVLLVGASRGIGAELARQYLADGWRVIATARDEAALADPALYTRDPAKFAALTKAIESARAEKDAAEERWLELAEQVEG